MCTHANLLKAMPITFKDLNVYACKLAGRDTHNIQGFKCVRMQTCLSYRNTPLTFNIQRPYGHMSTPSVHGLRLLIYTPNIKYLKILNNIIQ